MKKLMLVIMALLMGSISAQSFEMDKEKLSIAQEKLLQSQRECRQMEGELKTDPFILNLNDEMKEGVERGEISEAAGERAIKMIYLMIQMSKDICSQIDKTVDLVQKEMAASKPTNVFVIKEHTNKLLDIAEGAALEIIELSKAPELKSEEQELLQIIGEIMVRAAKQISHQRNNQD
ncbi:MAG: hypothetical protein K9K67_09645 [Bacteriovoracaceae bacterium]|nr:hypothetical protein [Bacteriovoracaceae bacterium]